MAGGLRGRKFGGRMERDCQTLAGILRLSPIRISPLNASAISRRSVLQQLGATVLAPAALFLHTQSSEAASLQSEAAHYLNAYRAKAGLGPLSSDHHLVSAASAQCAIMIAHGKIGHDFGAGTSFSERMFRAGVAPGYHAENVARGQRSVAEVMQAWMNSRSHRRNMLDPQMSSFGIASKSGYWALDLAGSI
jgi:uncharacterized protein YkwD